MQGDLHTHGNDAVGEIILPDTAKLRLLTSGVFIGSQRKDNHDGCIDLQETKRPES